MRNKRLAAIVLCGTLLLGGCGKPEAGRREASQGSAVQGEVQEETGAGVSIRDEGLNQENGNVEAGVVVIETGPEKKVYDAGNLVYTLRDFKLYESPEEASIDQSEMTTVDARYYMDRSKFLTMQVDINNIDYAGDEKDGEGEMNISLFTISPNEPDESQQWAGSYPVYLAEHGEKEKYYHVWVKPGETKTVMTF